MERSGFDTTYRPLLNKTQAYLRVLLSSHVPDSELSEAWDDFYRIYSQVIWRFAVSRGVPADQIEDCVQEVWSSVATGLVDFKRPTDRPGLRGWLNTIVRNKAIDFARKSRRKPTSLDARIDKGDEPAASMQPAEPNWDQAVLTTLLEELRPQISPENFSLLHLRIVEGKRTDEVADLLSLSNDVVRARMYRLRKKLLELLGRYGTEIAIDGSTDGEEVSED